MEIYLVLYQRHCLSNEMDPWETGWECVDWMHLTQEGDQLWALVNTVMNVRVP